MMSQRTARLPLIGLLFAAVFFDTLATAESIGGLNNDEESWLPSYVLEMPDSVDDILIADADSATMFRFKRTDTGVVQRDQRYMSVGRNGVGKQRAWDRRTPLGVYFITDSLDVTRLADKYGIAAFPLDYPNAWDRYNERTGNGIWLHGVDAKAPNRPARDTDGCLALPNEELALLVGDLRPHVTPIIVARNMRWSTVAEIETVRRDFRGVLELWRSSLERGDLSAYLSLYDDDFRSQGMGKIEWSTYRLGAFEAQPLSTVALDEVMLLADPEEPDLYLSRFVQTLVTAEGPVTLRKRLYWRRSDDDWRIVSEDAG